MAIKDEIRDFLLPRRARITPAAAGLPGHVPRRASRPRLAVVGECCLDNDPEVHRVLVQKVFPRPADVTTSALFAQGLD